jgi:toxin-antitoxin system PIN domain toxin
MVALLDINVLIALAWPNHIHHEAAHRWFKRHASAGWATCPLTQAGFVRVSSNTRVLSDAKSPREAIDLLTRIIRLPHHVFWSDDISITDRRYIAVEKLTGCHQITDAHLLGLALKRKGRLATLDSGIAAVVPRDVDKDRVLAVVV